MVDESKDLTLDPVLPRRRRPPKRIDSGSASHIFSDPKSYCRKQCFEALDTVTKICQERGMPIAAKSEKILLDAANGTFKSEEFSGEIMYSKDLHTTHLITKNV